MMDAEARDKLAKAANAGSWFKQVGWMEEAAFDIVGPALQAADPAFRSAVLALGDWLNHARR
jgi:hypothetical protein